MSRRSESAAIWVSHGPADAFTTVAAADAVGIHGEANPIVRELLALGTLPTVAGMCAAVAIAAAAWPVAADAIDAPPAAALLVSVVGLTVAALNMAVVLG